MVGLCHVPKNAVAPMECPTYATAPAPVAAWTCPIMAGRSRSPWSSKEKSQKRESEKSYLDEERVSS